MADKTNTSQIDKARMSDRDKTLINILERMVDQMQKQDLLLEDVIRRQNELIRGVDGAESHRGLLHSQTDKSLERLSESIIRFRSDMLSLVNEQDHINKNIDDLSKLIKTTTFAVDNSNKRLADIDERAKSQEKSIREHYEHSLKQAEVLQRELADTNRSFAKLHMDTEKRLGQLHQETQRQLKKLQQETMRRLLALDGIDSALQTLLIRTEPPEKKSPLIVRIFKNIVRFFRKKLPSIFVRIRDKH